MRLLRITTNYSSYLASFYAKHPELINKTYSVQFQEMLSDCFGWADFWTHALQYLGYEVWEPIANVEPMQKAWAKENGTHFTQQNWINEILTAQVKSFAPSVLFVDDCLGFSGSFIRNLRQECSSIKLVLGWCGAPNAQVDSFHACDIILSNIPEFVNQLRQQGHRAEYFKHAFEPRILQKLSLNQEKLIDFSFIGSIFKGNQSHNDREILIKELLERTDLRVFADVPQPSSRERQTLWIRQFIYNFVQKICYLPLGKSILSQVPKLRGYVNLKKQPSLCRYVDRLISERADSPVFGVRMFQTLRNSKITFNNHINFSSSSASNLRLFEATGVGTCLLTDWKDNLSELFEPEREVVTYKSLEEGVEKVKWLLDHPQEREAIAKAGQARTLKDHTFAQRAIQLNEIIKRQL